MRKSSYSVTPFNQVSLPLNLPLYAPNTTPLPLSPLNLVLPPSQNNQLGSLLIGTTLSILKREYLSKNNVSVILSCNKEAYEIIDRSQMYRQYTIKYIDVIDHPSSDIRVYFDQCFQFIEENRERGKNVLVQCHAGASRSASIVIAYLMRKNGWGFLKAVEFVQEKRPRVKPNQGFVEQLKDYEKQLRKVQREEETDKENDQNFMNAEIGKKQEYIQRKSNNYAISERPFFQIQNIHAKNLQSSYSSNIFQSRLNTNYQPNSPSAQLNTQSYCPKYFSSPNYQNYQVKQIQYPTNNTNNITYRKPQLYNTQFTTDRGMQSQEGFMKGGRIY